MYAAFSQWSQFTQSCTLQLYKNVKHASVKLFAFQDDKGKYLNGVLQWALEQGLFWKFTIPNYLKAFVKAATDNKLTRIMRKSEWYINMKPLLLRKSNNCKTVLFHHRLHFQCFGQINKQLTPIYTFIFTYISFMYNFISLGIQKTV